MNGVLQRPWKLRRDVLERFENFGELRGSSEGRAQRLLARWVGRMHAASTESPDKPGRFMAKCESCGCSYTKSSELSRQLRLEIVR